MKPLIVLLAGLASAAAVIAQPQQQVPGLRGVLRQYHQGGAPSPPLHLSPAQRAELRRQLAENARRSQARIEPTGTTRPAVKRNHPR